MELLGSAHSHPAAGPVPSATDCRLCVWPALMVIMGVGGPAPELVGWWIAQPPSPALRLPWKMEN